MMLVIPRLLVATSKGKYNDKNAAITAKQHKKKKKTKRQKTLKVGKKTTERRQTEDKKKTKWDRKASKYTKTQPNTQTNLTMTRQHMLIFGEPNVHTHANDGAVSYCTPSGYTNTAKDYQNNNTGGNEQIYSCTCTIVFQLSDKISPCSDKISPWRLSTARALTSLNVKKKQRCKLITWATRSSREATAGTSASSTSQK